jgi:hypothetical protein
VEGEGAIGRSPVGQIGVHYARAYTAYGPITTAEQKLHWMTLRPHQDHGNKSVAEHRHLLAKARGRKPFQATTNVDLTALVPGADGVAMQRVEALSDAEGLEVHA